MHSGRQIRVHTGLDPDSAVDHVALQFDPDPLFLRGAVYRAVSHATALVFPCPTSLRRPDRDVASLRRETPATSRHRQRLALLRRLFRARAISDIINAISSQNYDASAAAQSCPLVGLTHGLG